MPVNRLIRVVLAFVVAACAAYVLASILFTSVNLIRLSEVGAEISAADAMRTAWFDLRGLAPSLLWTQYGSLIFIGLAIAFPVAALLRYLAVRANLAFITPLLYPLAGAMAIVMILVLSFQEYEVYAFAGARGLLGNLAQCFAGASAGYLFQILTSPSPGTPLIPPCSLPLAALASVLVATGAAASDVAREMRVEVFAQGFDAPWGLELLPDGRALVTERTAGLTLLGADGSRLATIENVPQSFVKLQGGLFDVVAHPQFATNATLYLSLAHGSQKHNTTRVVRAVLQNDALVDVTVIFDSTPKGTAVHYGGRLAFMPDGTLLVTTGEGADYREDAQRLDSLLGKVIRLNDDGSIPPDNPFVGRDEAEPAIWSYGHRNPQGLFVDAKTGSVYAAEHGPRGGDEVNLIERQANYGWPIATHGIDYPGSRISPFESYPGMREPLVYWTPSIGVGGVAVYRGEMFPEWEGDIFVAALGGKHLRRIDMNGTEVVAQERLLEELQARFRQIEIGRDGALYVVVESLGDRPRSGQILRITRPIRPAPTTDSSRPST